MHLTIETEREADGRWIAAVPELPGVLVYADAESTAIVRVRALALRVLADRIESGEVELSDVTFSESHAA